jgi:hypothetical protein
MNGNQFTGIVRGVEDGLVRISIGGRTVWVVGRQIERFQPTHGGAC